MSLDRVLQQNTQPLKHGLEGLYDSLNRYTTELYPWSLSLTITKMVSEAIKVVQMVLFGKVSKYIISL